LERCDDGLFRAPADANGQVLPLPADENARLTSGSLEGSNVNATSAMVDMINTQRRYDMNMKAISSAEENEKAANSLLTMN
jgi:flagellar basal-body rod protein FlgF